MINSSAANDTNKRFDISNTPDKGYSFLKKRNPYTYVISK